MYMYTPSLSPSFYSMTAGVSSMAWIIGGLKEDSEPNHHLVTRDLLGSGSGRAHGGTVEVSAAGWGLKQSSSVPANRQLLDLNFPPTSVLTDDSTASSAVCTLEKVKLALERAEREALSKLQRFGSETSKPSSSTTTSSLKRRAVVEEGPESSSADGGGGGEMMAAGCTRCFMLVLVPKSEPRCPQCNSHVSLPSLKKQRVDLNLE